MILSKYENNELKRVIAICDCGCSAFEFLLFDNTMYISVLGNRFYEAQGLGYLAENARHIKNKLLKRDVYIAGIFLTPEDTKELFCKLREFKFEQADEYFANTSHPELELYEDEKEIYGCELFLKYDGTILDMIRNKTFRGYDIGFDKGTWDLYLSYLGKKVRRLL